MSKKYNVAKMGNADTKLHFRKAVIQLTTRTAPVDAADEEFWEQFWSDSVNSVQVKIDNTFGEYSDYNGYLNTELVRYLIGKKLSGCRMFQFLNVSQMITRQLTT